MTTLKFKAAVNLASELLQGAGMNTDDANVSADCIVASDAWGIGSHGLMRLPFYLERLKAGGINPNAKLKEITNLPSLRIFDGEKGMGHWQLKKAAEVAANIADTQGIAAVGIGNSNHCGALGIYVWPMLEKNLVGIIFSTGPAVMPPWGGNKPLLSTSPLAAGIPTNPATIIDLATSAVARGKIAAKAQKNEELEPGWAFDENGAPTIDAKVALKGMLAPLCPYGQVGDTLWVRETWAKIITPEGKDAFVYRADDEYYKDTISDWKGWKPSIFMPKEACRLVLKITNVRAERLNDISDTDAISEGIAISSRFGNEVNQWIDYIDGNGTPSPVYSFQTLWQSINGEKSWNENPFVWVIEFRKIK